MPVDFITDSGEKRRSVVRNQILKVLSKEYPLSLAAMHRKLRKNFGLDVSFQGTIKAANLLVENGVLERNSSKEYKISKKWVLESKRFFDSLSKSYNTRGNSRVFNSNFNESDYAEYKLGSLFELDNFWSDFLVFIADNFKPSEKKEIAMFNNLGWWFLINYGQEISLFQYYKKKGFRGFFVYPSKNFVNEIAVKNYIGLGFKAKIVGTQVFPKNLDLNVVGDSIIQVHYPKKLVEKLWIIAKKYRKTSDIDLEELNRLLAMKCEIRLVFFKNPEISKSLKSQLEMAFKGK